jgi:hypothetical protein
MILAFLSQAHGEAAGVIVPVFGKMAGRTPDGNCKMTVFDNSILKTLLSPGGFCLFSARFSSAFWPEKQTSKRKELRQGAQKPRYGADFPGVTCGFQPAAEGCSGRQQRGCLHGQRHRSSAARHRGRRARGIGSAPSFGRSRYEWDRDPAINGLDFAVAFKAQIQLFCRTHNDCPSA